MQRPGRSAGLLFCGVVLQILLVVLCEAVPADGPHGAETHTQPEPRSDETAADGLMARHGAPERNVQTKLRRDEETEEIIVEDNDITHGTLPPAAG